MTHLVDLGRECTSDGVQIELDDLHIIDLCTHSVHSIRGRAYEDAVVAGDASDTKQQVYDLVRSHAEEDVVGRGDVAEVAEEVLDG